MKKILFVLFLSAFASNAYAAKNLYITVTADQWFTQPSTSEGVDAEYRNSVVQNLDTGIDLCTDYGYFYKYFDFTTQGSIDGNLPVKMLIRLWNDSNNSGHGPLVNVQACTFVGQEQHMNCTWSSFRPNHLPEFVESMVSGGQLDLPGTLAMEPGVTVSGTHSFRSSVLVSPGPGTCH